MKKKSGIFKYLIACAGLGITAFFSNSVFADEVILKLSFQNGEEITIEVPEYSHEIELQRDAATGLPTGKRQHKPFSISKEIDKSTPLLLTALVNNENIAEWELKVFSIDDAGNRAKIISTVVLSDAVVCDIEANFEATAHTLREHVTFCYQRITWTYQGGFTLEDDWR